MTLISATFCKTRTNTFIQGRPICSNFPKKKPKNSIFDQLFTSTTPPPRPYLPPPPPLTYSLPSTYPLNVSNIQLPPPTNVLQPPQPHPPHPPPTYPPPMYPPPPQRTPPNVPPSTYPQAHDVTPSR